MNNLPSRNLETITAEIKMLEQSMKKSMVEHAWEIGKRLVEVKEDLGYGDFGGWIEQNFEFSWQYATQFMRFYKQTPDLKPALNLPSWAHVVEILYLPESVDRQEFIGKSHTIPSTGEVKTIDEMTRTELREVKKALKATVQAKNEAETQHADTIDKSNRRIKELELKLEEAKKDVRVKEVVKEVVSPELTEKVSTLEQQLQQERDKRKKLQAELEERDDEITALTRSQLLEKDRYKIDDLLSEMNSQIGRYVKKVEMEINKLQGDRKVSESVMASVKTLRSSADQLEKLLDLKNEKGGYVDAEYSVVT